MATPIDPRYVAESAYLAPLNNENLWRLRQVMRSARTSADLNGWEDTANECSDVVMDTYVQQCTRLPDVYAGHLS